MAARQDALAAAIKTRPSHGDRGDLIPPLVGPADRREVRADFKRRNPTAKDGASSRRFRHSRGASLINKIYPADEALPTVPPLLLRQPAEAAR